MGLLFKAVMIIVSINLVFMMIQGATLDINPSGENLFYDCEGDLLGKFRADDTACRNLTGAVLVSTNATARLPEGTGNVGEGGVFGWITDSFNSVKRWFSEGTGFVYLKQLLGGPNRFVSAMLPADGYEGFAWAVSAWWYALTLLLVIAFIKGGDV